MVQPRQLKLGAERSAAGGRTDPYRILKHDLDLILLTHTKYMLLYPNVSRDPDRKIGRADLSLPSRKPSRLELYLRTGLSAAAKCIPYAHLLSIDVLGDRLFAIRYSFADVELSMGRDFAGKKFLDDLANFRVATIREGKHLKISIALEQNSEKTEKF